MLIFLLTKVHASLLPVSNNAFRAQGKSADRVIAGLFAAGLEFGFDFT